MGLPADPKSTSELQADLLAWFDEHGRALPWRDVSDEDPYEVLVREVMLQQTRMETALPYLERWLERWPTVEDLAQASEDDVLDAWQGLGYYNRARWLRRAARQVVAEHDGRIPKGLDALEELPGVGPYTAAAIRTMAHDEPAVPVDGNVARVGCRLEGIEGDPTSDATKREVDQRLHPLVEAGDQPGRTAEALIELGALVCTPEDPACGACPLSSACTAYASDRVHELPEPIERPEPTEHVVVALLVETDEGVLVRRRPQDGLLGGLWGLPMAEREGDEQRDRTAERLVGTDVELSEAPVASVQHVFTHKRWRVHVHEAEIDGGPPSGEGWQVVDRAELDELASATLDEKILDALAQTTLARWS